MCILLGYNPQIILCHFFHKMNLVIFEAKVNRYKVSCILSCFLIVNIFKDKHKVVGGGGGIDSLY